MSDQKKSTTAAIAKREPAGGSQTLLSIVQDKAGAFMTVAPKHFSVERMIKLFHGAVTRNPKLGQCTPASVLVSLMRCAELGLEPNSPLGGMWLIPFSNKFTGKTECQGIIDYRAMVALARRSDQISSIAARAVYDKDDFEAWEDENGPHFKYRPATGERGEIKLVFAYAKLKSGEVQFDLMNKTDVDKIRNRSRSKGDGPWVTDYDEMAKKTVLRRLSKMLPLATEAQKAVVDEEAIEAGHPPVTIEPAAAMSLGLETDATTADEVLGILGAAQEQEEAPPLDRG